MNASTHISCPNAPERRNVRAPASLAASTPTVSPAFSVMTPANIWPTDRTSSMSSGTPSEQVWPAPQFHLDAGLTAEIFGTQASLPSATPAGTPEVTPIAAAGNSTCFSSTSGELDWLASALKTPAGANGTAVNDNMHAAAADTPTSTDIKHEVSSYSLLNNACILDEPDYTPSNRMASGDESKHGSSTASSHRTPMDQQPIGFFPSESMPDAGPSMCFRNAGA